MSSVDSIFDYSGVIPRYFDVVVKGGGPGSVYLLGLYSTLRKLEKTGDIRISNYVASDVAAILCVCLCSGVDQQTVVDFCRMMFEDTTNDRWKKELMRILPLDAYAMCNHRVHIFTSAVPSSVWFLFLCHRPVKIFTEYRSNRDLVEACSISFRKPAATSSYRGCQKQLMIQISSSSDRRFVFPPQSLFQQYKMTHITELMLKAEDDAGRFFLLHTPQFLSDSRLQWHLPFPERRYRLMCCFFLPSVALLFLCFRKHR